MTKREELAREYAEKWPTKPEWIEGKKFTGSVLAYEVREYVADAFEAGFDARGELDKEAIKGFYITAGCLLAVLFLVGMITLSMLGIYL
jgi:hypothetical protein